MPGGGEGLAARPAGLSSLCALRALAVSHLRIFNSERGVGRKGGQIGLSNSSATGIGMCWALNVSVHGKPVSNSGF